VTFSCLWDTCQNHEPGLTAIHTRTTGCCALLAMWAVVCKVGALARAPSDPGRVSPACELPPARRGMQQCAIQEGGFVAWHLTQSFSGSLGVRACPYCLWHKLRRNSFALQIPDPAQCWQLMLGGLNSKYVGGGKWAASLSWDVWCTGQSTHKLRCMSSTGYGHKCRLDL